MSAFAAAENEAASREERPVVILVHGFRDTSRCWDKLIQLLKADSRFSRHEFIPYEYPTHLISASFLRRLPSLKEVGQSLAAFLDFQMKEDRPMTLMGHSMGGLVIQSALLEMLDQGRGEDLKQVRQAILFATPNFGSGLADTLRHVLYALFPNAQERSLRLLAPEIHNLANDIQRRVVTAHKVTSHECPIAIQVFWGQEDGVVDQASARALFPNNSPLPGDHSKIIRPNSSREEHYLRIADAILEPCGHLEIFEVEEYDFRIQVEPMPLTSMEVTHGSRTRKLQTDNVAAVTQQASFSRKNRCSRLFRMGYATQNSGFVRFHCSHQNQASPFVIGHWEDYGTCAEFHFQPAHGETFTLVAEIFGGFDLPFCDITQHLDGRSRIKRYSFTLNLSRYIEEGHLLTQQPTLCVLPRDTRKSEIPFARSLAVALPGERVGEGIWRWKLRDLYQGMLDVRWRFDEGCAKS
jgi:pimeloyl-ACP methyl ester carboxylesterase